jgi:hypothetical protein
VDHEKDASEEIVTTLPTYTFHTYQARPVNTRAKIHQFLPLEK